MSQDPTYLLRWKGQQVGPFTKEIIEQKVRDRELSLAHEISVEGKWRSLRGFLKLQAQTQEQDRQKIRLERMQNELDEKQLALEDTRSELEEAKRQPAQSQLPQFSPRNLESPLDAPAHREISAAPQTSGFAVTGLVMGILSLLCFGPVFGIMGIIFSGIARSRIQSNPKQYIGGGMATAGLTLSIIGSALWILWWSLWWATFTSFWAGLTGALQSHTPR